MDKQIIKLCTNCVNEFGLADVMKNHYVKLRTQVVFTHGICKRHYIQSVMSQIGLSQAEAEENSKKINWNNAPPDLKDHPELIQQYKEGNFMTPETTEAEKDDKTKCSHCKRPLSLAVGGSHRAACSSCGHPVEDDKLKAGGFPMPMNEAATEQDVTMLKIINKYDQRKMAVLYKLQEQLQKSVQSNPAYKNLLNMVTDIISKRRLAGGWWDSVKAKAGQVKTQWSDYQIRNYANVLRKEYKGLIGEVGTAFGMPSSENVIVQLIRDNAIPDRPLLPQTIQRFNNSLQMYLQLIETLDEINTTNKSAAPLTETFVSGPLGSENFKICRFCEIEFRIDPNKLPGAAEGKVYHGTCSRHATEEWMKRMKMTRAQAQAAIAKSIETAAAAGTPITPDLQHYSSLVARYKKD